MTTMTATPIEKAAKLYEQGKVTEADTLCCKILKRDKNNINALHLRGVIAYQQKNYNASTKLLSSANNLATNNINIMFALAASHENIQQYKSAIKLYKKICVLNSANIAARQQLANLLEKDNQLGEALASYQLLNEATPKNPNIILSLARIFASLGLFKKAESMTDELVSIATGETAFWNDFGLVYSAINDPDKAITCFKKALSITDASDNDNHSKSRLNLASALQDSGKISEAKQHYLDIIKTKKIPNEKLERTHYNLALIYLGEGDFANGWKHLVHRPKIFTDIPDISCLSNKKVLILGEEGIGDELTFLRFIPLLEKYDVQIDYIGNPKLTPLLERVESISALHTSMPSTETFDYCISAMDLPYILSINAVSVIPPLRLIPDKTASNPILNALNTSKGKTIKLGITWRSGIKNDKQKQEKSISKEISISELCSVIKHFSGTIVILQRNPDASEIEYLKNNINSDVIDASASNNDLNEMLSILDQIDHYIGVSNTNMHLYGSLGKRCDVIIPFPGEWRWMWKGEKSPWYENFHLFRLNEENNVNSVINYLPHYLTK